MDTKVMMAKIIISPWKVCQKYFVELDGRGGGSCKRYNIASE
jgi:hypothetical protein